MSCRNWEERIVLHAAGDLPPGQAADAERHLAECSECRELAAGVKQDLLMLHAAHAEPIHPAHFAAVRARVLQQVSRNRRPAWRLASIAAALAVLIAAVMVRPRRVETPPVARSLPPVEQVLPPVPEIQPVAPQTVARKRPLRARPIPNPRRPTEPLMVKLITDDPDVVIYWIAN